MTALTRSDLTALGLTTGALTVLYLMTSPSSAVTPNSAEMLWGLHSEGMMPAPGYSVMALLLLPLAFISPGIVVLAQALLMAVAVGLLWLLIRQFVENPWSVSASAVLTGVSSAFWHNTLRVEFGATQTILVLGAWLLLLMWSREKASSTGLGLGVGLLTGLAAVNHWSGLALLPPLAFLLWIRVAGKDLVVSRLWPLAAGLVMALPVAAVPLLTAGPVFADGASELLGYLTAPTFRGNPLLTGSHTIEMRLFHAFRLLFDQFGAWWLFLPFMLLSFRGFVLLAQSKMRLLGAGVMFWLSTFLLPLAALSGYQGWFEEQWVSLMPPMLVLFAVTWAVAIDEIGEQLFPDFRQSQPIVAGAFLLLASIVVVGNWLSVQEMSQPFLQHHARNLLEPLPEDAVLLVDLPGLAASARLLQQTGLKPNALVIDRNELYRPEHYRQLAEDPSFPEPIPVEDAALLEETRTSVERDQYLLNLLLVWSDRRPVHIAQEIHDTILLMLPIEAELFPQGLSFRMQPVGASYGDQNVALLVREPWESIDDAFLPPLSELEGPRQVIGQQYLTARLSSANYLRRRGAYQASIRLLGPTVNENKNIAGLWMALGRIYEDAGQFANAEKSYYTAANLQLNNFDFREAYYRTLKRQEDAEAIRDIEAWFTAAEHPLPPVHVDDPIDEGRRLLQIGDLRRAEHLFIQYTIEQPNNAMGWLLLGETRERMSDLHGAILAYEQLRQRRPDHEKVLALLGDLYMRAGAVKLGAEALVEMHRKQPGQVALATYALERLVPAGDLNSALLVAESWAASDSQSPQACLRYGEILIRKGDLAAAEAALKPCLELRPATAEIRLALATIAEQRGDYDEALQYAQQAQELSFERADIQSFIDSIMEKRDASP